MARSRRTSAALTALALTGVLTLAGCASATTGTAAGTSPSAAETVAPAVEAPAAPAPATGATLTAAQTDALPDGQSAYEMGDGTLVLVTATEPMPAPVLAEIQAQADAATSGGLTSSHGDASSAASTAAVNSGKEVLFVYASLGNFKDESMAVASHAIWTVAGARIKMPTAGWTKEDMVAAAQAYIDQQADPSLWTLVVQAG